MLTSQNLYEIAKCRYNEANILLNHHKADGAVYLCGYAMELILKWRIVKLLDWDGYPESSQEFQEYKSFKVHDLNVLLRLAGLEKSMKSNDEVYARWQIACTWDSEIRYKELGRISETEANDIIKATRETINFILKLPLR